MKILIQNGRVLDPASGLDKVCHLALAAGRIGCTTFAISVAGVFVGNLFGARYKNRAEFVGGAILILIGLKILLEHLGVISF